MDDHRLDRWDRWNKQAQEKPVKSQFWDRLHRLTNAHVLYTMRSRDAEEKFPAIYAASKQFGEERLLAYLEVLFEWSVHGIMPYSDNNYKTVSHKETKAKYLLDNKEILETIMPPRKIPGFLYRGISVYDSSVKNPEDVVARLKGMQERKESLFYSTNKPVTSWTTHESKARRSYAYKGIVIECPFKLLVNNATPFIWPYYGELEILRFDQVGNYEWVFWINKRFRISKWAWRGATPERDEGPEYIKPADKGEFELENQKV